MPKGWKNQDSQASLEAERYENPIPSRVYIMEVLAQHGGSLTHRGLCRVLGLTEEEHKEALLYRLKAMLRDNQLLQNSKNAYVLMSKMKLIKGKIQGNKDGFGFLIPDDGGEDLYLSPKEMRVVFDGDEAVVRETGADYRGRREGQIIEVLAHNTTQVVGRYYSESGAAFVVPENARTSREIIVQPGPLMPTDGQYVLIEITVQPGRRNMPSGIIKEILGNRSDAGMEVEVAVRTHSIPHEWPEKVLKQVKRLTTTVAEKDKLHRVDLRQTPFVTIDGEDARDFDDAVFCEPKKSGGWRLFVVIADVSHYVKPNTALDEEAQNRGTSVYFPGHVIPMLPEVLSNGLCSLNPQVDRLAMVCEMTISAKGKISGYQFYEAVICSHARLTYTDVWEMLSHSETGVAMRQQQYSTIALHLDQLYDLFKVLLAVRGERGTIDFDTVETQIIFGRNRKIEKIVPRSRNDAHKLIEECMLCANVCAARFLEKHKVPGLYRVHEGPTLEKKLNLNSFLGTMGLALTAKEITPHDLQTLLHKVKDRPDYHVIQTVVLRSMSQAIYSGDNKGHFGLAFKAYAHFTSPIRRYPDLLVHRAIRHIIRSDVASNHVVRVGAEPIAKKRIYPFTAADIETLGEHCSITERRADLATRDAMDWLKCEYMQQHVGESFTGIVSAVTGFGLFVELQDVFVEGLVHITNLPDDYYIYDNAHHCLKGERTGRRYRLGDTLEVMVSRVDIDDKKIDFELMSALQTSAKNRSKTIKKGATSAEPSVFDSRFKSANAKAKLLREAKAAENAAKKGGTKKSAAKKVKDGIRRKSKEQTAEHESKVTSGKLKPKVRSKASSDDKRSSAKPTANSSTVDSASTKPSKSRKKAKAATSSEPTKKKHVKKVKKAKKSNAKKRQK